MLPCCRDTPLRYLGYANEVGEAFRALMHVRYLLNWSQYQHITYTVKKYMQDFNHRWVRATYGVASAYVLADTYDKGVKQSKVTIGSCLSGLLFLSISNRFLPIQEPEADTSKVAIAAVDTLLWQALASVIVPGVY